MILDGFGKNPIEEGNAVAKANKPNIDKLMMTYKYRSRKNCLSRTNKNYEIN